MSCPLCCWRVSVRVAGRCAGGAERHDHHDRSDRATPIGNGGTGIGGSAERAEHAGASDRRRATKAKIIHGVAYAPVVRSDPGQAGDLGRQPDPQASRTSTAAATAVCKDVRLRLLGLGLLRAPRRRPAEDARWTPPSSRAGASRASASGSPSTPTRATRSCEIAGIRFDTSAEAGSATRRPAPARAGAR